MYRRNALFFLRETIFKVYLFESATLLAQRQGKPRIPYRSCDEENSIEFGGFDSEKTGQGFKNEKELFLLLSRGQDLRLAGTFLFVLWNRFSLSLSLSLHCHLRVTSLFSRSTLRQSLTSPTDEMPCGNSFYDAKT